MKILTKLTFAALLGMTAAQAAQAEKLVIANGGGLGFQGSIVGYTPNPFPPYPSPRPIPIPRPGPVCLSCPPYELKPDIPRLDPGFGGVHIMR